MMVNYLGYFAMFGLAQAGDVQTTHSTDWRTPFGDWCETWRLTYRMTVTQSRITRLVDVSSTLKLPEVLGGIVDMWWVGSVIELREHNLNYSTIEGNSQLEGRKRPSRIRRGARMKL